MSHRTKGLLIVLSVLLLGGLALSQTPLNDLWRGAFFTCGGVPCLQTKVASANSGQWSGPQSLNDLWRGAFLTCTGNTPCLQVTLDSTIPSLTLGTLTTTGVTDLGSTLLVRGKVGISANGTATSTNQLFVGSDNPSIVDLTSAVASDGMHGINDVTTQEVDNTAGDLTHTTHAGLAIELHHRAKSAGHAATVTNGFGEYIHAQTLDGGTVTATNVYGLYLEAQTVGSTLNRALHVAGSDSYFGGKVITNGTNNVAHEFTGGGTGYTYAAWAHNTGASGILGIENSAGGGLVTGSLAYATVLSTLNSTALQLGTNSAAPIVTILANGNVGVGDNNSGFKFSVAGTGHWSGLTAASGTPNSLCLNAATKEITEDPSTSCLVSARDQKDAIEPIDVSGLATVLRLAPRHFVYRDAPERQRWGFIADEVQAVDSRLGDAYTNGEARSIDIPAMLALLTKAVQEQQAQIDALQAQVRR